MKGFPKVFSTKQDFYNVLDTYPDKVKAKLRELMEGRFIWKKVGEVDSVDDVVINEFSKVITTSETTNDNVQREFLLHMVLEEDYNSEFYRLGWTIEEASRFLTYESVDIMED